MLEQINEIKQRLARMQEALGKPFTPLLHWVTTQQLRSATSRTVGEAAIRARCQVVNIDPITAICRVLGRYKMFVDLRDAGFAPHLMMEGYWEYWNTEFMWNNVKPGSVCVDVGANHGYFSILLADLVGANGFLYSIEPNPRLHDLLNRTVQLNGFGGRTKVIQAAVGAEAAELPFLVPITEPKNARLVSESQAKRTREAANNLVEEIHTVRVHKLDDLVEGAVDFVKIDVEGAEEAVWQGMQKLIDRSPQIRILMEVNTGRCKTPRQFLDSISARFPLREVDFSGISRPISHEDILGRTEDTMLDLVRDDRP
jgi:FkbM family methyltransferase